MEKQLTALIVDDEEKALTLLNKLLEDTQQFSTIRCAHSSIEAKKKLADFQPDLIFLDIKMHGKDGFALLRELEEEKTRAGIIFVTAYFERDTKIRINTRTGYFFIDPSDILYCQADGNYSVINTGDKQHMCSLQLGIIQEKLPEKGFVRLGRSLIINFRYLSSVDRKRDQLIFEKAGEFYSVAISAMQLKELAKVKAG